MRIIRDYRNNSVFEDYVINTFIDEMLSSIQEMPLNNFMLTGLVSYFLQRGVDDRPLKNIIFKTTDINIFNLLAIKINELNTFNLLKHSNRIIFEIEGGFQNAKIEVWFDPDSTESVNLNGINCEKYSRIKAELL